MADSASIGFQGNNLCVQLTVGGTSLAACISIVELRKSLKIGTGGPFIPMLPELPPSLQKRMTPGEVASYNQACGVYKNKLAVAIQGGTV